MLFNPFLAGILYVTCSYAAPTPIEQRDISPSLFSTFQLVEQYAAAAYCQENNDSPGTQLECHFGNCPLVEAANTNTTSEFENSLLTDVTGYVAIDNTNNLIVIAFRGSASFRSWLSDFIFGMVPTSICSGCSAHLGFWTSWKDSRNGVLEAVRRAVAANPGFKVICTGHSLGGAIASLAAAELRNAGHNVSLYTFGAPRFGNSPLSDYITNQPGANYRITHINDPVPHVPPSFLGYGHISPEYYISTPNFAPTTPSDITVCSGSTDMNCNSGWILLDVIAHTWYFNLVGLCYPPFDLK